MPWRESPEERARARAEIPVIVPGPLGRLFGVYTPPAPDAPDAGLCAILFTTPRMHRNRVWVEGARRLAARGFACFRLDFHGAGDSDGETSFRDPNQPYREDAVATIRHLRDRFGHERFVLSGACFDARTALSAFRDEADAIVGLVFLAAPVMELETMVKVDADRKGWGHMLKAVRNPDNWKALGDAERWRYMGTMLGRMARRSVSGDAAPELPLSDGFVRDLGALVASRARALFLYGLEDSEYESFRIAERDLFAKFSPETRERIVVEVWPGTVHGFLEMTRQRQTFERAMTWISGLHPSGAATDRPTEAAWTSP
jgi:alpha/beta superfamily hydrolase